MDHVERLVSLANVWCTVKFLHPYLAYRNDIDWDEALVAALPKVLAADTTDAYAAAVQAMLGALGDPVSRVSQPKHGSHAPESRAAPLTRETKDGIVVISFGVIGDDWDTLVKELRTVASRLAEARGIVFDMRDSSIADLGLSFSELDLQLSMTPLSAPGRRSRVHAGFVSQAFAGSGGYHSAFQIEDGTACLPHKNARDVPCVFIVNEDTSMPMVALALQKAGKAAIMVEGEGDDSAIVRTCLIEIGEGLQVQLRLSEIIYSDGRGGFEPDVSLPASAGREALVDAALAWIATPKARAIESKALPAVAEPAAERRYPETDYPSLELRLLAAFRIWGILHYFFPYKDLTGKIGKACCGNSCRSLQKQKMPGLMR